MQDEYWYPQHKGEDNPILPSLQKNIKHRSTLQQYVEKIPTYIPIVLIFASVYYVTTFFHSLPIISYDNITGLILVLVLSTILVIYFTHKYATTNHVYLLSFATSELPEEYEVSRKGFFGPFKDKISPESLGFIERVVEKTGLGDRTHLPKIYHQDKPQTNTMKLCREEVMDVMTLACDQVFEETGIKPTEVDYVITNCSIFNPTPSMAAMLMNHYKMKQTCKNYHLGGHGCAASITAADLAKKFIENNTKCSKNMTTTMYMGDEKSRLLFHTLFRSGGAAYILSNNNKYKNMAKYELESTVCIHNAVEDEAHRIIYHSEDNEGIPGISIGKSLVNYVAGTLDLNVSYLFPQYLTGLNKLKYWLGSIDGKALNFKETFQGICIHCGGRGVIDAVQKKFDLTDEDCMPSRAKRCNLLKKGDRVLQFGFGSGMKCTSAVWRKLI
ncbi:3-ketoacyl-CoA synthase [Entamoeba marina]